jgi:pyruvate kinase
MCSALSPIMRRTKIVCTLGPASESEAALRGLAEAGMDVARLNFSHGAAPWHQARVRILRRIGAETGRPIAVLQDLSGPKLRIGNVPAPGIDLHSNSTCRLSPDASAAGDPPRIELPVPELLQALAPGHQVFLGDGLIALQVERAADGEVECQVMHGGQVHSHMGISAPSVPMAIAATTEKDLADVRLGVELGVDWVAVSFVRAASDLTPVRARLAELGADTPVMAKIERPEAVANLEQIAAAADGLMVARGDLGVEMPLYQVPMVQKQVIAAANRLAKPVVTATQMLDSMTRNPRPTRAEVSDVANAILDGTDAVMLSGETAIGKWPALVVRTMAQIAEYTERGIRYQEIRAAGLRETAANVTDAIAQGAAEVAGDLHAAALLCSTSSGATARALARLRPAMPLVAATASATTCRRLAMTWGVSPVQVAPTTNTEEMVAATVRAAQEAGWIAPGDLVVVASGARIGTAGQTNLVKVQTV